jgi:hypothetical protein
LALPARAAKTAMGRVVKIVCSSLLLLLASAPLAQAQIDAPPGTPPGMASRLAASRASSVQAGRYTAGDDSSFTLETYGTAKYLLRFAGRGENFVLATERGSLGVKLLKYDTGTVALRVSVWGGVTRPIILITRRISL